MRSDESGTEQAVQPAEPQEVQRNLPQLLGQLAEKFGDGAAIGAGTYLGTQAAKTVKEKVFGGQDKGGAKPEPPGEQPPPPAE